MNKLIKRMFFLLGILCLTLYLGIAYFYKDVFIVNTWINGIYCTGKSVEEVNSELLLHTKAPFLTIVNEEGRAEQINMAEFSYKEDYMENLVAYQKSQNSFLWPLHLGKVTRLQLFPSRSWDEEALKNKVICSELICANVPERLEVKIVHTKTGYELVDNLYHVLKPEVVADFVNNNLKKGIYVSKIAESNGFYDAEATVQQQKVREMWDKLQRFMKCDIVYDMGAEQISLDKEITSKFVKLDEKGEFLFTQEGEFLIDEEGIYSFVDALAEKYNTVDKQLQFVKTSGEIVEVPYKNYGTQLDTEAEKEYLLNAFTHKLKEVHIPQYKKQGYVRGKNDIGNTYIEVDMTAQKLYGYKDGELLLETDIVTGNMRRKWNTPVGVNHVYAKQKKRVLRGPGYATPVDFWMPVNGSIGIHDADWRKEFGGEIYLTNGSHGCVNIPPEVMPVIYEEYEVGTPVIMFY